MGDSPAIPSQRALKSSSKLGTESLNRKPMGVANQKGFVPRLAERPSNGTRSRRSRGLVEQLCRDSRNHCFGHSTSAIRDDRRSERVRFNRRDPEVFLGGEHKASTCRKELSCLALRNRS